MGTARAWSSLVFALAAVGCAHVDETRSRHVLDEESVRWLEERRPELSRPHVRILPSGQDLAISVLPDERCLVRFGERVTFDERVRREPSPLVLAGEAGVVAVGGIVGIAARQASTEDELDGYDVISVLSLGAAVGAAVALGVDASKYGDETTRRVEDSAPSESRVAPCVKSTRVPSRIELGVGGRKFVARLDGHGRARLRIPPELWQGETLDLDVAVDGVPTERLLIRRLP